MNPHEHVVHPTEFLKQEETRIAKFNNGIAIKLGKILGNMWFFYFCILLDLCELPAVISANTPIAWVNFIAQTVIQLIALPILQVYQNIQEAADSAKADVDHKALTYLATLQDEQMEILKLLKDKVK